MARWLTPIVPAARSITSWDSRSPRCCGASSPARARPAGCSRWRCGSSATASSRSKNSSRASTGRCWRRWRRRGERNSRRASSAPTARKSSGSTSAPPPRPFTTSTLQQEASRKLGFAPAHTMRVAQRLYEGVDIDGETIGLITYMRTDGVDVAEEALAAARRLIGADYGRDYLPPAPRQYQTKAKNAQEAHEAIRPTDAARRPREMKSFLDHDQARLYELIWLRMVASQMESAELERTTADITANAA